MTRQSSVNTVIKITDTTTVALGDTLVDKSTEFLNFPSLNKEWLTESQIPFTGTSEIHKDIGVARIADVSVECDLDNAAGSLWRWLQAAADARTILTLRTEIGLTPNLRYRQMDVLVTNDSEAASGGALTKGNFTLRNAGNYAAGIA